MVFELSWLIMIIGTVLALMAWGRTKRAGPAISVFLGGIIIMVLADPGSLGSLANLGKTLLQQGIENGFSV